MNGSTQINNQLINNSPTVKKRYFQIFSCCYSQEKDDKKISQKNIKNDLQISKRTNSKNYMAESQLKKIVEELDENNYIENANPEQLNTQNSFINSLRSSFGKKQKDIKNKKNEIDLLTIEGFSRLKKNKLIVYFQKRSFILCTVSDVKIHAKGYNSQNLSFSHQQNAQTQKQNMFQSRMQNTSRVVSTNLQTSSILFSKYENGIKIDYENEQFVIPEKIAQYIAVKAENMKFQTVTDVSCNVGSSSIQFAKTCYWVLAMDENPKLVQYASHNTTLYGVLGKIDFLKANYEQGMNSKTDLTFVNPRYNTKKTMLDLFQDFQMDLKKVLNLAMVNSKFVFLLLPAHTDVNGLPQLLNQVFTKIITTNVVIENIYFENKLKYYLVIIGQLLSDDSLFNFLKDLILNEWEGMDSQKIQSLLSKLKLRVGMSQAISYIIKTNQKKKINNLTRIKLLLDQLEDENIFSIQELEQIFEPFNSNQANSNKYLSSESLLFYPQSFNDNQFRFIDSSQSHEKPKNSQSQMYSEKITSSPEGFISIVNSYYSQISSPEQSPLDNLEQNTQQIQIVGLPKENDAPLSAIIYKQSKGSSDIRKSQYENEKHHSIQ